MGNLACVGNQRPPLNTPFPSLTNWHKSPPPLREVQIFRFRVSFPPPSVIWEYALAKLEHITPETSIKGILPEGLVTVINVKWIGSVAIELTYKDAAGMAVRPALAAINQTLDEVLAEQEGEFDPDTRWAVAWFNQFGMEDGPFGQAETLSRAKNTAVNGLVEAGIISARAGKVRLLNRSELIANWNPATDKRRVHWEIAQYLIRAHDTAGESAAADLLRQLGAAGEIARDLAYRLYNICERKKWPAEALAYNSLVIAWPEISRLAHSRPSTPQTQENLFK